jgi:hypothetical protein
MTAVIRRLLGVYDADHTLSGEVAYWVGARLGRRHCSLCDITHGLFSEKNEWKSCKVGLPIPFETFHRDDQPEAVRAATGGRTPIVVAITDDGVVELLEATDLEHCQGSPERLIDAVEKAATRVGLAWSSDAPAE